MKSKMIKIISATCTILLICGNMFAQSVGINDNASEPTSSAMLDVSSTSKGFLPPRVTYTERNAISIPLAGLMVWCSNCGTSGELQVYNGTSWTNIIGGAALGVLGVPGAPTIGTATAGDGEASVSFTQPSSNGGSTITSYTATSSTGNISGTLTQAGSGTITVTGLANGTAYTFTVTATNAYGTGPASDASNSVTPAVTLAVGTSYGGGKIAYIFQPTDPGYVEGQTHGLIAASSDQGTLVTWYNGSNTTTGATGTALGTGSTNTTSIINNQGNTGSYAAKICRDYAGGGYNDWYLPSKDELYKLYLNRDAIGGFYNIGWYWTSTENSNSLAWYQVFTGAQATYNKSLTNYVRAVRTF